MTSRDSFLHDVAAGLPFGQVERDEIIEELRAHVEDSIAALESEGLAHTDAERSALDSLGSPERLARALTRARRSRRRLLAAAGAGSWAVASNAIYYWIVGGIIASIAIVVPITVFRLAGPFAVDLISLVAWAITAYIAGSAVVPVVAERAGYSAAGVRRVVGLLGAAVMAVYALIGWYGPLDAVGVAAVLTLPAWWILGTRRQTRVRARDWRTFAGMLVIGIVAIASIQAAQAWLLDTRPGAVRQVPDRGELGLDRIAAPIPVGFGDLATNEGNISVDGLYGAGPGTYILDVLDATKLDGWHDLRVEAWRAVDPGPMAPTPVSPTASAPFVVAPAVWHPPGDLAGGLLPWTGSDPPGPKAQTLTGTVELNRTPWVTAAWVALTGIAPDGTRYLIAEPDYVPATFNGTPLDWLAAALR